MATSESDDFESADEELNHDIASKRGVKTQQWSSPTTIDSESDDDMEYVPQAPRMDVIYGKKVNRFSPNTAAATSGEKTPVQNTVKKDDDSSISNAHKDIVDQELIKNAESNSGNDNAKVATCNLEDSVSSKTEDSTTDLKGENNKIEESVKSVQNSITDICPTIPKSQSNDRGKVHNQKRLEGSRKLGAKKIGTRIVQPSNFIPNLGTAETDNIEEQIILTSLKELTVEESLITNELTEPEELKSDKKFKEVFQPEGWEGLGDDIELPEELSEEKLQPILERLSSTREEIADSSSGWGSWGNWGVSSLINTATAGVSSLTSHVSHGLTLLEESMGVPDPAEVSKLKEKDISITDDTQLDVPDQSYSSFGFDNFISGVSSITKLVESTGSKVMSGGLDTLEAIGKKTMEVLQEGDPGLKKKRAFFLNETDKPILSQVLREAKEKAEAAEKTVEEKQRARKVHFESLFDDYQGLVHLEALEMLSKQSNIKIQQQLAGLDTNELNSVQETLEDVRELCDLGEDDENVEDNEEKNLKLRLQEACKDLGINITYDKLYVVWEDSQSFIAASSTNNDEEIFQCAISALAQFTALSVERFHKTAELLLIKERRSTVNEADALVQLTRILSNHIGVLASTFCSSLNELVKTSEHSANVTGNITTIFMEASNASSYIQDAFRLLVPIIQVGAI